MMMMAKGQLDSIRSGARSGLAACGSMPVILDAVNIARRQSVASARILTTSEANYGINAARCAERSAQAFSSLSVIPKLRFEPNISTAQSGHEARRP